MSILKYHPVVMLTNVATKAAEKIVGLGKSLFEWVKGKFFTDEYKVPPILNREIDPLTSEVAYKRLRFYQTMGFCANPWAHRHPTYHQGIADHELIVLSYPQPINEAQYQRFVQDLRLVVMDQAGAVKVL